MVASVSGIHLSGTHAARPAANTVPDGSLYSCSTDGLLYKSAYAANTWSTWATLGGSAVTDATISTSDITTNDASTSKHGWLRKLSNVASQYLDGTGAWSVPAGGGSSRPWLDTASNPLDGTYGDDFDGASLNGRWTRRNLTSGMETYQSADGSHMRVAPGSGSIDMQYTQGISAGDFEFVCSMTVYPAGIGAMYGLFVITSAGAGRGILFYSSDNAPYHASLSGYTYSGFNFSDLAVSWVGRKLWYRLRRVGNDVTTNYSMDGINWSLDRTVTDAASFDRVMIGRVLGTSANDIWSIDRFDRVV